MADAVTSLRVGPAGDLATQVGPLIRPPDGALRRQLTILDEGEQWLVEPGPVGDNAHLWRPGVKVGVRPGSELHLTECFGPVLGILRADDLDHALTLQNAPVYGLTGGIQSLDRREVQHWLDHVEVGNAYVNRHITGAIVRRQPFGGWKRSVVGPAVKAGGPGYVASLGTWRLDPSRRDEQLAQAKARWPELAAGVDPTGLAAESNVLRLRPLAAAVLRLGPDLDLDAVGFSLAVAAVTGTRVEVSSAEPAPGVAPVTVVESNEAFVARLAARSPQRIRLLSTEPGLVPLLLDAGHDVDATPVAGDAEVELRRWSREQAVSTTRHRHGNLVTDG